MKIFIRSGDVSASTGISDSFDVSKAAVVVMAPASSGLRLADAYIVLKLSAISGVSSVTCKVTTDAAGDDIILPSTIASIDTGLTTSTVGVAGFSAEVPIFLPRDSNSDSWYIHLKGDAGSFTVSDVTVHGKSF